MAVFLAAAMMLSAMPSWLAASDAIPLNRNGGPAVDLMMTLFGYHAGLALCVATARSAPTPQRLLLFALWSALASFALFHYFAVDYPGHYALVLLGPALVLPWLIRGMRFPRRTAAGLAMGLSSCAVIFLQAMLHIFVILPAAENFAHGMEMRRAAIHATQTPAELEVLERSGMVRSIPEDASHPAYVYVNEAGISAIRERRARLEEDRPAVLKTWIILGDNEPTSRSSSMTVEAWSMARRRASASCRPPPPWRAGSTP